MEKRSLDSAPEGTMKVILPRRSEHTTQHTIHLVYTSTLNDVSFKGAIQKSQRLKISEQPTPRRCICPTVRRTLVKTTSTWQSQCSVCVEITPKSLTSGDYLIILFSIVIWRGKAIMLQRKVILTNVCVLKAVFPLAVHHFTTPLRLPRVRFQSSFELVLWYSFRSFGKDRELQSKINIIDEYSGGRGEWSLDQACKYGGELR